MKAKGLFIAVIALVLLVFSPARTTATNGDGSDNLYDVLENIGPTVFDGTLQNVGNVMVIWEDDYPFVLKDGLPVLEVMIQYSENQVVLYGVTPATNYQNEEQVQVTFFMSAEGNLVVGLSDWQGYDSTQIYIESDSGDPITYVSCVCYGGTGKKIKKRKCTAAECADAGVNCNTVPNGPAVYCENREPMPAPTVIGDGNVALEQASP